MFDGEGRCGLAGYGKEENLFGFERFGTYREELRG